jgi:hypoxanthine phosphoribosyltransferase
MRERLEYVFENQKLYSWIFFGDDKKPKKKDKIERDFPDTRNITLQEWEEYERGLDDTETDS